jgi:hypothetical protein
VRRVDAVQKLARLLSIQHWRLSLLDHVLRSPHRTRRVERQNLADHQPVKEHPHRSQVLLHRRCLVRLPELLDVGGDHDGLHLSEFAQASLLAPGEEAGGRAVVGSTGGWRFGCWR